MECVSQVHLEDIKQKMISLWGSDMVPANATTYLFPPNIEVEYGNLVFETSMMSTKLLTVFNQNNPEEYMGFMETPAGYELFYSSLNKSGIFKALNVINRYGINRAEGDVQGFLSLNATLNDRLRYLPYYRIRNLSGEHHGVTLEFDHELLRCSIGDQFMYIYPNDNGGSDTHSVARVDDRCMSLKNKMYTCDVLDYLVKQLDSDQGEAFVPSNYPFE